MQAHAGLGLFEILFWILAGNGLVGLPPADRDPVLLKAVPPQTLLYFEWAARGNGQAGAPGVDGFAADLEVRQFAELLEAAIAKSTNGDDDGSQSGRNAMLAQVIQLATAHAGCAFVGFEPPPPAKTGLQNWMNMLQGVHGGIILSSGQDTNGLWDKLNRSLSSVPGFQFDAASRTQTIPTRIPNYPVVMHQEGQRIIFALGEKTLPRILDGLSGRLPGLDKNPRFQRAVERVSVPRVATVGWVDLQEISTSVIAAMGPLGGLVRPMLVMVGADALDHVVQTSGVDHGIIVKRTFIATGGRTDGILVLAAGRPIEPKDLAQIPADADLVFATSISLTRLFQEARQLLAKAQPLSVRVFDEAVKAMEAELNLRIVDDVLPAFGDVVTAFDSPAAGGFIATSLVCTLEVRDPAKSKLVFERLMKFVEQSLLNDPTGDAQLEAATLSQQQFLGHNVYYINSPSASFSNKPQMVPTFCLYAQMLAESGESDEVSEKEGEFREGAAGFGKGGEAAEDDSVETGFKTEQSKSAVVAGKMLLSMQTKGEAEKGEVVRDYKQLMQSVKQGAMEAMNTEQIPPGYHDSIKSYFDKLEKSKDKSVK